MPRSIKARALRAHMPWPSMLVPFVTCYRVFWPWCCPKLMHIALPKCSRSTHHIACILSCFIHIALILHVPCSTYGFVSTLLCLRQDIVHLGVCKLYDALHVFAKRLGVPQVCSCHGIDHTPLGYPKWDHQTLPEGILSHFQSIMKRYLGSFHMHNEFSLKSKKIPITWKIAIRPSIMLRTRQSTNILRLQCQARMSVPLHVEHKFLLY